MPTPQPDSQEFDIDVDDIDRLIAENEALGLHGNTADLDANFRRVGAKFRAKDRPLPDDCSLPGGKLLSTEQLSVYLSLRGAAAVVSPLWLSI